MTNVSMPVVKMATMTSTSLVVFLLVSMFIQHHQTAEAFQLATTTTTTTAPTSTLRTLLTVQQSQVPASISLVQRHQRRRDSVAVSLSPKSSIIHPRDKFSSSRLIQAEAVDSTTPNDDKSSDGTNNNNNKTPIIQSVRDKLRQITGFSFTVFRATLRGITGISMTAIYASTVAATGLWIRKISSAVLSLFPSGFRYFLQPFLVMYYVPLFMLRSLTGPYGKRARAKHEQALEAWKEAVEYAERTEQDGYWPVIVSPDDGYFELQAPPAVPPVSLSSSSSSDDGGENLQQERSELADALAETVDRAMDIQQQESQKD
jgi:hypothetical protein